MVIVVIRGRSSPERHGMLSTWPPGPDGPRGPETLIFESRARISSILGVEAAIFLIKTHQCRWGASPPPALMGFEEEDDRFDPKNRQNPGPTLKNKGCTVNPR